MKFKVRQDYLQHKVKSLKPYTTAEEKEALLASDDSTPQEYLKILSNVESKNEAEAMYLIQKLREISVSDVLEGMVDCPKCNTLNQFQLELNEDMEIDESIPCGIFYDVDDIIDSDDLPINYINELQDKIMENNKIILNLHRKFPCRVCNEDITVDINPTKIISNTSLTNIYQEYFLFGKFLHYSNRDVDVLKPFERSILFKILKKDVETAPKM